MKKIKNNSLISTIILIVVGIWLFVHPGESVVTAVRLVGAALLLIGAVGIVSRLARKGERSTGKLVAAIAEAVVGVVVIASPGFVVSLFPRIAGILIAVSGVSDIVTARRMKKAGGGKTGIILAVITVILGLMVFANPFKVVSKLVRLIGLVLIYKGVTGLFIRAK